MGQKRIISEMRKRGVSEKIIQGRINTHKAKVEANIAREIIYLQLIHEDSWKREQAYENRKLVKAGKRESCKQRKRRLRKEYLASKNK
jgi:hypothetical protein